MSINWAFAFYPANVIAVALNVKRRLFMKRSHGLCVFLFVINTLAFPVFAQTTPSVATEEDQPRDPGHDFISSRRYQQKELEFTRQGYQVAENPEVVLIEASQHLGVTFEKYLVIQRIVLPRVPQPTLRSIIGYVKYVKGSHDEARKIYVLEGLSSDVE